MNQGLAIVSCEDERSSLSCIDNFDGDRDWESDLWLVSIQGDDKEF